jgi:hypothetical protein
MKRQVLLLRIAYWIGAILDGAMLPPMLVPSIGRAMFGIPDFNPGAEYKYAMYIGAALMAGWTVLLVWADRKPVERRGVILLTLVPVLAGLFASSLYASSSGLVAFTRIIPTLVLQFSVTALYLAAYFGSRNLSQG